MKKQNFKDRFAILCIIGVLCLFSGCEKEAGLNGETDILYGKWQLIAISTPSTEGVNSIDYSQKNVVYEFKPNNVLTVSGDVENEYGGLKIGNHVYEVTLTEITNDPLVLPGPHTVKINGIPYGFSFGYMPDRPGMQLSCRGECNQGFYFVKK